jgi:spore germination protein YaaH
MFRVAPCQVWFDDPVSLAPKYALAAALGLRGVGMWNLDALGYASSNPVVQYQTAAMWAALGTV